MRSKSISGGTGGELCEPELGLGVGSCSVHTGPTELLLVELSPLTLEVGTTTP